ncbi:DUF1822 family protein, partial [Chamaesiphon sp. GL140_3_metabinner_50]|uniref:DUF1822 family protein n=1 Tax=Chamaesiphon sp. GL140_3_metabinner_50 TaxID=2970812 RepID=UPI0025E3331D
MIFTPQPLESQTIWMTLDDVPTILERTYSNTTARHNALLNQICLHQIQAWLTEIGIESTPTFSAPQMASIWDVVNGCALTIGNRRLILIPSDKLDREEFSVPQEWVDIPAWMGDYYLAIQIDLDERTMNIWGYTSHRTLRETGTFDRIDRNYNISSDFLIGDLDILWMAQLLDLQEITTVPPIPNLNADRSHSSIDRLSHPSPYSPRLDLDFNTWAAIVSNNDLREQLYHRRLQVATLQANPAPIHNLTHWLQQEFSQALEQGWDLVDRIMMRGELAIVRGGNMSSERAKLIDLQYQLDRTNVVMLIGIKPQDDTHVVVSVQVYPVPGTPTLPPQLKLSYITDEGEELEMVIARDRDFQIQL